MADPGDLGDIRWRTAIRSGAIGSVARLATLALAFVLTPVTITHAGPATYGILVTLTSFAGLLTFADFGVGNGVIGRLATARAAGDTAAEKSATAAALAILVVVGLAVAGVGIVLAVTLPWHSLIHTPITDDHPIRVAMVVASVAIGFGVPGALAHNIYLGQQRAGLASAWLNVAAALAAIGVAVAAVNGHHLQVMVAMALGVPAAVALMSLGWLAAHGAVPARLRYARRIVGLDCAAGWSYVRRVAVRRGGELRGRQPRRCPLHGPCKGRSVRSVKPTCGDSAGSGYTVLHPTMGGLHGRDCAR